jgi:hypothetical protein
MGKQFTTYASVASSERRHFLEMTLAGARRKTLLIELR